MAGMLRALLFAALVSVVLPVASAQPTGTLRVRVALLDDQGQSTPVPRYGLLLSNNPPTTVPRLIVTGIDGSAEVKLRPGSYTVESDKPVNFGGKAYSWMQVVDVVSGKETVLELGADSAEVGPVTSTAATIGSLASDPSFLLPRWRESVVALWTSTARASGFLVDASGLIVTNQRAVGTEPSAAVQLSPTVKLAASVVVADAARDVAVLRADPQALAGMRPVPLSCAPAAALAAGQEVFTLGVLLRHQKDMAPGAVTAADPTGIIADFALPRGLVGGPVFTASGDLAGLTSLVARAGRSRDDQARVVGAADLCHVVAAARARLQDVAPPGNTRLPVEPARPFPAAALQQAAARATTAVTAPQLTASAFDVAFITPVLTYTAYHQATRGRPRTTSKDTRTRDPEPPIVQLLLDFANWTEYVFDYPPVLLVRVTPRLVEGFWTKVARGAAQTQGISIPAIKRVSSGFARLQAFCGETEVVPIHPFRLEHVLPTGGTIHEGLYAFDPAALGPHCASVRLVLYAQKEPQKGDSRVVDAKILQQVWQDFAPYREPAR
jgi:S1-C subfamily serine protease